MPKYWKRLHQILEVSLVSRFDTIAFGSPCSHNTSFINIWAMLLALCIDLTRMKWDAFKILSTMTIIELCYQLVLGNPVIKTMDTISHFYSRISKGCNNLVGC